MTLRAASLSSSLFAVLALSALGQTPSQVGANPHIAPTNPAPTNSAPSSPVPTIAASTSDQRAEIGVQAILPNGRQIRPVGTWIPVLPFPFAIALTPDGSEAAVPSIGFPFGLNIIHKLTSATPSEIEVQHLPGRLGANKDDSDPAVEAHAGLAYAPDGKTLYLATGNSGKIDLYSTADWRMASQIPLDAEADGTKFTSSFAATVIVSADGKTLYALDQGNWRVAVIDAASKKVIHSLPTGAYPMGIALSPDQSRLYVTNIGLFEYTSLPFVKKDDVIGTGLKFPPFGYPSKEAREGAVVEGKKVPGLGPENTDRGSSLWTYNVADPAHASVTAKLRLGTPILATGDDVGGSAPTGVVAGDDAVYVSLAHQDAVAKITPDGKKVVAQAQLSPFTGARFEDAKHRPLRGVMPSGLALRNGKLYVAESGIDAVAVLDTITLQVEQHIPAGWNPSAVTLSPDGKTLYVVNTKGKGAGPNGGKEHPEDMPSYIGSLEFGSVSVINLATLPPPAELTAAVIANNSFAIANRPQLPKLKHCFLVVRENRTYDEVLGDVAGSNGDATLARYGLDGWAEEANPSRPRNGPNAAEHLSITPNLHALAKHYAMSDNFYVDSDVSADGHRWVLGINPTAFFNTAWTSGYGDRRTSFPDAAQPGRRALFGGADAPMPEDEPQFGSLWEHIANSGLGILNYGESLEVEGGQEIDGTSPEGQRVVLNSPIPKPVFEHSDRRFPTFNLGIPDQLRFEEFKRDFDRRLAQGKIPGLIVIRLPGDHTASPRPEDGYPFRASYVADNDLALGRIVNYLSTTSIWKDSAFFVTEDDAQGGIDHVDAHRSVLMVASPWVTPGSISHQHSSMGSITRTINELLGLGPLNLEDALAGELYGIFSPTPNLQTFAWQPSDPKVFDPAKARIAKPKTKQEAAELRDMDDADEIRKQLEKSKSTLKRPKTEQKDID